MRLPTTYRLRRIALAALAAIVLLLAGATQADAKPKHAPPKAKHGVKAVLAHRTLLIDGNRRANRITLRTKRHAAGTLQVDVGSNGSSDFSFSRKRFTKIVVHGAGGADRLVVEGSPDADNIVATPAGRRVRVTGVGVIVADGFESLDLNAGAGADALSVGDLAGTGVEQVELGLGKRDAAPDSASVTATP